MKFYNFSVVTVNSKVCFLVLFRNKQCIITNVMKFIEPKVRKIHAGRNDNGGKENVLIK